MILSLRSRTKRYLRENWGALFIIVFMVLLIFSAAELSYGLTGAANNTAVYAFYALVLGVALQVASYVKYGEGEEQETAEAATLPSPPAPTNWDRRKKLLAISITAVVLISAGAAIYLEYPTLQTVVFHQTYPALTASISFANTVKEPDGTIIATVGVSAIGGNTPYQFSATWSDGVVQNSTQPIFIRNFVNQTVPASASLRITSADGQNVTLTAQIPPPS